MTYMNNITDMNNITGSDLQEVTGGLDTTETGETLSYLSKAQEKGIISKDPFGTEFPVQQHEK